METLNNVCPTEILIDLKDDNEFLSSHINSKENNKHFATLESNTHLKNKEVTLSDRKHEIYQSILDVSPSRINEEFSDFKLNVALSADEVQSLELNGGAIDDCPTAILVDVPSSSSSYLKEYCTSSKSQHYCRQDNKLSKCKVLALENQDLKEKVYACSDMKNSSEMEESHNSSPNLNEMENEISIKRLRWITPSPQSMSRISKEASKVVHNLNSSAVFDEDSLLTEEILPIPINFENFDLDDNIDQGDDSCIENACEDEVLDHKLPVNIQTQNIIINNEIIDREANGCSSFSEDSTSSKIILSDKKLDISAQLPPEKSFTKVFMGSSNELGSNSELCSSEIHSDSLDKSEFSASYDGSDDVFVMKHVSSEDKENIQENLNHAILTKKINISNKTMSKRLVVSRTKSEHRGTFRNLSNIKHEANVPAKCQSFFNNKKVNTPLNKMNLSAKIKETHPLTGKLKLKKAISVETQNTPKIIPRSNTFQSTKELISSAEKSCSAMKDTAFLSNSVCKSSSSDVKQQKVFTKMKTPSKRYSMCTPLKSASTVKPPLTPALSNFQNAGIPQYTPQSTRASRLSFSRSWQQSTDVSRFSTVKGLKQQTASTSSNTLKDSFARIESSKQGKQSFSQSMSAISFQPLGKNAMSTSSKRRFCSKLSLPSPLPVSQDRKLARALFPSVPKK